MPHHHHHEHAAGFGDLLEVEAALARELTARALDSAASAVDGPVRVAIDLGAGTGAGTLALAHRFPDAQVHSLDLSPELLERLASAAEAARVADRVHRHLVDLDEDWTGVVPERVDLAWASLSLHHVADPARVLERTLAVLRPGGVLVITEMTPTLAFTPDDLGVARAGIADRLTRALAASGYPPTADWTAPLAAAGFRAAPPEIRELTVRGDTAGRGYLAGQFAAWQERLADRLDAADLGALAGVEHELRAGSSPVTATSGRAVWVAVRP